MTVNIAQAEAAAPALSLTEQDPSVVAPFLSADDPDLALAEQGVMTDLAEQEAMPEEAVVSQTKAAARGQPGAARVGSFGFEKTVQATRMIAVFLDMIKNFKLT